MWGMTTRETVIGVQDPQHAIAYHEAVAPHTTNAARLLGEEHPRGTLAPGRLADLTVCERDPAVCPAEGLRDLDPTHTLDSQVAVSPCSSSGPSGRRGYDGQPAPREREVAEPLNRGTANRDIARAPVGRRRSIPSFPSFRSGPPIPRD
ncbi:amidohydrolase family protein [Kitasatospora sp. NPDC056531]|uniref:amidohydrolase family protein n=1 Tax=Kitasatospora sp. NPDC056531 TaxID=3345856 RepID=UPI0036BFE144